MRVVVLRHPLRKAFQYDHLARQRGARFFAHRRRTGSTTGVAGSSCNRAATTSSAVR
jgi:hypothetical protein